MPRTPQRAGKTPKGDSRFVSQVVADQIRARRSLQRMSQDELARRMKWFDHNWSRTTVSQIEAAERTITLDEFIAVGLVLGVNPVHMLLPYGHKVDLGGTLSPVNQRLLYAWFGDRIGVTVDPETEGRTLKITANEEEPEPVTRPSTPEEIRAFFAESRGGE